MRDQDQEDRRFQALEKLVVEELEAGSSVAEGPRMGPLFRRAIELGFPREEARRRLAEVLDRPDVHEGWSRWSGLREREEIRFRLDAIRRWQGLPEGLVDFVLFFFRASDPSLYQPAALAAGIHSGKTAALRERLSVYAASRGLDLARPVELKGTRAARRLFLVQVAATLPAGAGEAPDPLAREEADCPQSRSDLSVLLLGLEWRFSRRRGNDEGERLERTLRSLGARDPRLWDRITVKRWARLWLLAVRSGLAVDPLWLGLAGNGLARLLDPSLSVGKRVELFLQLDELLQALSHLPPDAVARIEAGLDDAYPETAQLFLRLRIRLWRWRREGVGPGDLPARSALVEQVAELDGMYRILEYSGVERSILSGTGTAEVAASVFERMAALLEKRDRWLSLSAERRGALLFFLLDLAEHAQIDPVRREAILRGRGLLDGGAPSAAGAGPSLAFSEILLRVLQWEQPGVEVFLDSRLLHQIDDERVLLSLLRTGKETPLLAFLADAVEHRLRLGLQQEAGFDPLRFLGRVSVRRPHASFYGLLREVVSDRVYADREGKTVPVAEWVQFLEAEAQGEASTAQPPPGAQKSVQAREALQRWSEQDDLLGAVDGLADLVGKPEENGESGACLASLFDWLHAGEGEVLREGAPAFIHVHPAAFLKKLREGASKLLACAASLSPGTLRDLSGRERDRLVPLLQEIRAELEPTLPVREAKLFSIGMENTVRRAAEWERGLTVLADVAGGEGAADPGHLLMAVGGLPAGRLREEMLRLVAREITPEGAMDGAGEWQACTRALGAALAEEQGERFSAADWEKWKDELAAGWAAMLRQAMTRRFESRVIRLVEDREWEKARQRPAGRAALAEAKPWLLDRYRLGAAAAAGGTDGGLWRTASSFFLHFSAIWIALLVGAILMLDFGDAWKDMAEVQDMRGIGLTFILGLAGAFLYLSGDLRKKVAAPPEEEARRLNASVWRRAGLFLLPCLVVAFALTGFLWFLLSGTEQVVQGEGAPLHITVWAGFSLFVGIFFGLLAKDAA